MPDLNLILSLVAAYLVYKIIAKFALWRRMPPGPFGLPFLGYAPFLGDHRNVCKLSKKYGPVFSVRLGIHDVVFMNDWKSVSQAFASEDLLARPHEIMTNTVLKDPSFGEMSGPEWREHRRETIRILRDVGFGKTVLEDMVRDEFQLLTQEIEKNAGKPLNPMPKILAAAGNVASQLVFSRRFPYDDPVKNTLDSSLATVVANFKFSGMHIVLPWLAPLLKIFSNTYKVYSNAVIENNNCCDALMALRENEESCNERSHDYISGYLAKMREKRESGHVGTFTRPVAVRNIVFVYGAATETVTTASTWTCLYLVKYPEYQEKIRDEIVNIIGSRSPSYQDKQQMPFTMAFIHEVLRIRPPVPLNLLRRATADIKIGEYLIPRETIVTLNLWAVNHDPKLWTDPDSFDPSRFLSEDGKTFVPKPFLTSFSGGKRVCPGESMAKVELFFFTVSTLQKFRLTVPEGTKVSDQERFAAIIRPAEMPDIYFESLS